MRANFLARIEPFNDIARLLICGIPNMTRIGCHGQSPLRLDRSIASIYRSSDLKLGLKVDT